MNFTPQKKDDVRKKISDYLLNGFIIRYDFRDEQPLEVLDRKHVKVLSHLGNIGSYAYTTFHWEYSVVEEIFCNHEILHEIVKELREKYSVRNVWCEGSGCCQYSTYAYYLDGE